ncbi:hypothetical protein G6F60_015065 [Rhizopus arrhizus]|nr:hypothetical protein G6F60_015065 [Rhizopus arrhizus]
MSMRSTPASWAPSGKRRHWKRSSATPRANCSMPPPRPGTTASTGSACALAAVVNRRAGWPNWSSASSATRSACARNSTAPSWACSARAGCGWCSTRAGSWAPRPPAKPAPR